MSHSRPRGAWKDERVDGEEEEREEHGKNGEEEESMMDRGFVMKLDDQDGHCDWVIGKVVGEGEKDGKETFEHHQ